MFKQVSKIFIIISFSHVIWSCNDDKESIKKENVIEKNDTMLFLTVNSEKHSYFVQKGTCFRLQKFQLFLDTFKTIPSLYRDTILADLTGDGLLDVIISEIRTRQQSLLYTKIISQNKIVWEDSLKPNEELSFIDWNSDSLYFKLKPYTTFYDAFLSKRIIEELENGKINEDVIEFYTSNLRFNYKDKNIDSISINIKIDSTINELRTYKGKLITSLDQWDRSLLYWNRNSKAFETLYTP